MTKLESAPLERLGLLAAALSDGSRLRLLAALRGGERCVCELTELLGLAPSTVSKHLSVLRQAGLVHMRKEGRWAYYRLPGRDAGRLERRLLALLREAAAADPRARADAERLAAAPSPGNQGLCAGAVDARRKR